MPKMIGRVIECPEYDPSKDEQMVRVTVAQIRMLLRPDVEDPGHDFWIPDAGLAAVLGLRRELDTTDTGSRKNKAKRWYRYYAPVQEVMARDPSEALRELIRRTATVKITAVCAHPDCHRLFDGAKCVDTEPKRKITLEVCFTVEVDADVPLIDVEETAADVWDSGMTTAKKFGPSKSAQFVDSYNFTARRV